MAGSLRKVPQLGEVFLDHVGWFVPDLDHAGRAFERLGFRLTDAVSQRTSTQRSTVPGFTGLANRCAMLQSGYLELLAPTGLVETPLVEQHRNRLDRYVGVHLIAFSSPSVADEFRRLKQEGFDPHPPATLRRPVSGAPEGRKVARFKVLRVPDTVMAEGRIQFLRHESPEVVWEDRLITRTNGIESLSSVVLLVRDPVEVAGRFGRFVGRRPENGEAYSTIKLDRGTLGFVNPKRLGALLPGVEHSTTPRIVAVGMTAPRLTDSLEFFASRGVSVRSFEGTDLFYVDPAEAMGTAVVVCGPDVAWPPRP